jgi:hypothetical protein
MLAIDERVLLAQLESEVTEPTFGRAAELLPLLRSPNWDARAAALDLLLHMVAPPPSALLSLVEEQLNDGEPLVRCQAVRVVSRHFPTGRALALLKNHEDEHPVVCALISSHLQELAEPSPDTVAFGATNTVCS